MYMQDLLKPKVLIPLAGFSYGVSTNNKIITNMSLISGVAVNFGDIIKLIATESADSIFPGASDFFDNFGDFFKKIIPGGGTVPIIPNIPIIPTDNEEDKIKAKAVYKKNFDKKSKELFGTVLDIDYSDDFEKCWDNYRISLSGSFDDFSYKWVEKILKNSDDYSKYVIKNAFNTYVGRNPEPFEIQNYLVELRKIKYDLKERYMMNAIKNNSAVKEQMLNSILSNLSYSITKKERDHIISLFDKNTDRDYIAALVDQTESGREKILNDYVYSTLLNRNGDPDGLEYYSAMLKNGNQYFEDPNNVEKYYDKRTDMISFIRGQVKKSDEYIALHSDYRDRDEVNAKYQQYLNRDATPEEFHNVMIKINSGAWTWGDFRHNMDVLYDNNTPVNIGTHSTGELPLEL